MPLSPSFLHSCPQPSGQGSRPKHPSCSHKDQRDSGRPEGLCTQQATVTRPHVLPGAQNEAKAALAHTLSQPLPLYAPAGTQTPSCNRLGLGQDAPQHASSSKTPPQKSANPGNPPSDLSQDAGNTHTLLGDTHALHTPPPSCQGGEGPCTPEAVLTGAPFSPAGPGGPWGPGLPGIPMGPAAPAGPLSPGDPWGGGENGSFPRLSKCMDTIFQSTIRSSRSPSLLSPQ